MISGRRAVKNCQNSRIACLSSGSSGRFGHSRGIASIVARDAAEALPGRHLVPRAVREEPTHPVAAMLRSSAARSRAVTVHGAGDVVRTLVANVAAGIHAVAALPELAVRAILDAGAFALRRAIL